MLLFFKRPKRAVFFFLILTSSISLANPEGIYITEGLIGYTLSFNQSPTAVTSRTLLSSQTGLGYVIGGWVWVGAMFHYTSLQETTSDASNTSTTHNETYEYYGPSFGYMSDSWAFILHWLAYAEQKDNVSAPGGGYLTDRAGSGFGLDVGYHFTVLGINMGPMIALKSINYQNCKDPTTGATSSCNPTITQFDVIPYFQFLFNFK